MAGYTPLFGEIVTSSIWNEANAVRIVWITLMALADMDGNVYASTVGLAPVARVSMNDCEKSIKILSSPDKHSRSKEEEGRRIKAIEGGWHIINHRKYRNKAKSRAQYFREYRQRKKETKKEITNKNTHSNTHSNSATHRNVAKQSATVAKTQKKKGFCVYNEDFLKFWKVYPKKVGKGNAYKFWCGIMPDDELTEKIIKAVEQQAKSKQWKKEEGRFIPNPATWLNQSRWEDELPEEVDPWERMREKERKGLI